MGDLLPEASTEFLFLFDVTGKQPTQIQVLPVPNAFQGLAWPPASDRIFVAGGKDDTVIEFVEQGTRFSDCIGRTAVGRGFQAGI